MNGDPCEQFYMALQQALESGSFVRLLFGKPSAANPFQRVETKRTVHEGVERLTSFYSGGHRAKTKHWTPEELVEQARASVGREFLAATVETTGATWSLEFSRKGVPRVHQRAGVALPEQVEQLENPWSTLLDPQALFLRKLGLVRAQGKPSSEQGAKLRQVEKFLENALILLSEAGVLPSAQPLSILDIGAGKSYLTFALYDLLQRRGWQALSITGVERRAELVSAAHALAAECGYTGLSFVSESVGNYRTQRADLVVALHACDTATDDALVLALRNKARAIMVAPCCQKYLRPRLRIPGALSAVYRHPILEEHLAVDLTDALRVLALEAQGYRCKLFEFVAVEHTARNTMITAVASGSSASPHAVKAREQLAALRDFYGFSDFYLDRELERL